MKKYIIILIVILLTIYISKSQNNLPPPLFFEHLDWSVPPIKSIPQLDVANFPQQNFMLGWQWDGHPHMTEALKMNINENHENLWEYIYPNNSNIPINYILQPDHFNQTYDVPYLYSYCFIYKPTLNFDANMNVINPNDPEHNIFGFRVKDNNATNS
jgi:hypothetical protein